MGGPCDGEYYGLPWPCWGNAALKHPGTPNLYDPSKPVAEGGLNFRARFGVEAKSDKIPENLRGTNLLAEGDVEGQSYPVGNEHPVGNELKAGHPEFTMAMLTKLGWDGDLTEEERKAIDAVAGEKTNWKTDLSGGIQRVAIKHGCAPFGNAKARTFVWTFPDPVPLHREPLYTNRRDLLPQYATYSDRQMYRLPTRFASIQEQDFSKEYPLILTSGRLVEYEGGGDESRSNPWLAELQQDMFAEINPVDANNHGIKDGQMIWLEGPEKAKVKVMAMVTERVGRGVVFMPFHFGGHFQGRDLRSKYPEGADPFVLGEAANTAMTYGYDSVTNMQETKATLCKVWKA
jgi:formate dehydrogenase major subunit